MENPSLINYAKGKEKIPPKGKSGAIIQSLIPLWNNVNEIKNIIPYR